MLGWRLLLSAILIPSLCGLAWLDHRLGEPAPVLLVVCLLLALRSVWELTELFRVRLKDLRFSLPAACAAAVTAAAWIPYLLTPVTSGAEATLFAYVIALLALFLAAVLRYRQPGANIETLAAEILIVSYVGLFLSLTAQLRWVAGAQAGYLAIGSLVIAAKCGDSAAYFLGRAFGRQKMAPLLSPGKTWMGAVGALAGSGLGGWAWLQFATGLFDRNWSPPAAHWSILYGCAIGVAGLIGDLCESLFKRDAGRKDSASLMPGFGGLLDLLDSILYAGPVAFLLWRFLPLATW